MSHLRWPVLLTLAVFTTAGGPLPAGDLYSGKEAAKLDSVVLPAPSEIQALTIHPPRIVLKGADDAQQIVLTAQLQDGQLQDLSGEVKYEPGDTKIVRV